MTALGIDIGGVDDVDPTLNFVSGAQAAAESVMSQLLIDPGTLWWAPTLGYNLVGRLNKPFDQDAEERNIQKQCELDERVKSASITASVSADGKTITIVGALQLTDDLGDVEFTLSVSDFEIKSAFKP